MPNTTHPLGPVDYAVLGLLRIAPRHGYELVGEFEPTAELGDALRVDLSNLYATLKRLERRGLILGAVERAGTRPPRHVYHLTPGGEAEFERWLVEPVRHNRDIRLDFVLKLFFSLRLYPERIDDLLTRQLAAVLDQLQRIQLELNHLPPGSFRWTLRQMRRSALQATLTWLELVRDTEPGERSGTVDR